MSAVDIIAIKQKDGTIKSSGFYVLFSSKRGNELVHLEVNGELISQITLQAQSGELYFELKEAACSKRQSITIDETDLAKSEGISTPVIHRKILEEEKQIEFEVAQEQVTLSPSYNNHLAKLDQDGNGGRITKSRTTSPMFSPRKASLSPRKSSIFEKVNSTLKSLLGVSNNNNNLAPIEMKQFDCDKLVLKRKPTSQQLSLMKLKDGVNEIKFITSVTKETATAKLFLWTDDMKVIVSDIDGTITKTDMRGLFYYKFGYDWTHECVVDLFKSLSQSGYQFIYLTARSVKVQGATRAYLEKIGVPPAPILCAPHNLFACVSTEFWKTTAEGKLMHLRDLRDLFPGNHNPFVAGFGNKVHDLAAYKEIKIPDERIYIINKLSEITVNGEKTKYDLLLKIIDSVFPSCIVNVV